MAPSVSSYLQISHSWPADDRRTTLGTLRRRDPRSAIILPPEPLQDGEAMESSVQEGSREGGTLPTRPSPAAPGLSLLVCGDRLEPGPGPGPGDSSSFTSAAFAGEVRPGLGAGDRVGVGGGTIA